MAERLEAGCVGVAEGDPVGGLGGGVSGRSMEPSSKCGGVRWRPGMWNRKLFCEVKIFHLGARGGFAGTGEDRAIKIVKGVVDRRDSEEERCVQSG